MKKIFIISSLIAALFATPSFATPTELDKKTVASKAYVDTKQDIITTGNVVVRHGNGTLDDPDVYVPGLVAYDSTSQTLKGNQIGILDWGTSCAMQTGECIVALADWNDYGAEMDNFVPTVRAVANAITQLYWESSTNPKAIHAYNTTFGSGTNNWEGTSTHLVNGQFLANSLALKQNKIARSGRYYNASGTLTSYNENASSNASSWLNVGVKGTGLVTKTSTDGKVGERKIFEATDVANYHATTLTQNQKDIQDISIPTVGAMMSAISSGITSAAPSGTPNTLANYDANGALGTGVAVASAASYDSTTGALENGSAIPNITALETKQNKMTCAGWDSETHTDEHCWLWSIE